MKKLMLVVLISNLAILTACKKTPEEKHKKAEEELNSYMEKFKNNPDKMDMKKMDELIENERKTSDAMKH